MDPINKMDPPASSQPFEAAVPQPTTPRPPSNPQYVFKPYEVKCPETFAWYTGYVKDLVEEDGKKKLKIKFPQDWKEEQIFNLEDVRPAPNPDDAGTWQPVRGEFCEAQARSAQDEPYGWWGCKIQSQKGGFYLIEFTGWEDLHNEVFGKEMLRPQNPHESLQKYSDVIHAIRVPVPTELHNLAKKHTKKLVGFISKLKNIFHFDYDAQTSEALIIGAKGDLKSAKQLLIQSMGLSQELLKLETVHNEKQAALEEKEKQYQNAIIEKWTIQDKTLIKYVCGKLGRNIKQAKSLKGVLDIKIADKDGTPPTVTIYAEPGKEDVVKKARSQLEICIVTTPVPGSCMGAIIGAKGTTITDIQNKSEVIRIQSWEKWAEERSQDYKDANPKDFCSPIDLEIAAEWENERVEYFAIIGKKSPCELASLLIAELVQYKMETDRLHNIRGEIDQKLQQYDNRRAGAPSGGRGGRRRSGTGRTDVCFDHQRGVCNRGENCRFVHEDNGNRDQGLGTEQQPRSNRRRGRGRGSNRGGRKVE